MIWLLSLWVCVMSCSAHASWNEHYHDIISVLGLKSTVSLTDWGRYISSQMIDNPAPFYNNFKKRHPGFYCKHRYFFHWGYNAIPWNSFLETKVKAYCAYQQSIDAKKKVSVTDTIIAFKKEIQQEQKRRNRQINSKTESLFGFPHGGRGAVYTRFFASMAYNVHLIGDYTSDNTDLEGLQNINDLIGMIVEELRHFDRNGSEQLVKDISFINKRFVGPQKKADALLLYLKQAVPSLVRESQGGAVYRWLKNRGFEFAE